MSAPGTHAREPVTYPWAPGAVPRGFSRLGRYEVGFARGSGELEAIQRLRFEVFNRERQEGLPSSWATGLDADVFDVHSHHLAVRHEADGVVGTYRVMTAELAAVGGFYAQTEFDLGDVPRGLLSQAVEVGRACVRRDHRNGRALLLLWRGLARYLSWNRKRFLFGCCSLPTVDAATAWRAHRALEARGCLHPAVRVEPLPALRCAPTRGDDAALALPRLFESYLALGARVCSPPAVDRTFGVTDFLVLLDTGELRGAPRARLFERGDWHG